MQNGEEPGARPGPPLGAAGSSAPETVSSSHGPYADQFQVLWAAAGASLQITKGVGPGAVASRADIASWPALSIAAALPGQWNDLLRPPLHDSDSTRHGQALGSSGRGGHARRWCGAVVSVVTVCPLGLLSCAPPSSRRGVWVVWPSSPGPHGGQAIQCHRFTAVERASARAGRLGCVSCCAT